MRGLTTHRSTFWYDGQQVIYEEVTDLAEAYRCVWGNGTDEALVRLGNGDIWYLDNQLGSVMALSDSSGQVIESYSYDVYGAVTVYDATGQQIDMTNYDNRYLFTSREYNWHTGLYHYRARTYHPYLGRFLSRDHLYEREVDPTLYSYCQHNPILLTDPFGFSPEIREYVDCEELFKEHPEYKKKLDLAAQEAALRVLRTYLIFELGLVWYYSVTSSKVSLPQSIKKILVPPDEEQRLRIYFNYVRAVRFMDRCLGVRGIDIECEACCKAGTPAYVWNAAKMTFDCDWNIHICPEFWADRHDEKVDTIIHELAHISISGYREDEIPYGAVQVASVIYDLGDISYLKIYLRAHRRHRLRPKGLRWSRAFAGRLLALFLKDVARALGLEE